MGEVIQLPKRNVQHASTEQLKHEWDLWADCNEEELDGVEFHYEQIKVAREAILMLMHLCEMCNVPDGPVLDFAKEALAKLGD